MIEKRIGRYTAFVLERDDVVVVLGDVAKHLDLLARLGFARHPETEEWVGTGAGLYGMAPEVFCDLFGGRTGGKPELTAQASNGQSVYQVDGLPLVEEDVQGATSIARIHALDLETCAFIEEGVTNFRVG